jgi:hypothetical protein
MWTLAYAFQAFSHIFNLLAFFLKIAPLIWKLPFNFVSTYTISSTTHSSSSPTYIRCPCSHRLLDYAFFIAHSQSFSWMKFPTICCCWLLFLVLVLVSIFSLPINGRGKREEKAAEIFVKVRPASHTMDGYGRLAKFAFIFSRSWPPCFCCRLPFPSARPPPPAAAADAVGNGARLTLTNSSARTAAAAAAGQQPSRRFIDDWRKMRREALTVFQRQPAAAAAG